jgi:hypothetical protein
MQPRRLEKPVQYLLLPFPNGSLSPKPPQGKDAQNGYVLLCGTLMLDQQKIYRVQREPETYSYSWTFPCGYLSTGQQWEHLKYWPGAVLEVSAQLSAIVDTSPLLDLTLLSFFNWAKPQRHSLFPYFFVCLRADATSLKWCHHDVS